jgi:hypothetical protein
MGSMLLVLATESLALEEAEAVWVEAAAPVRARTTTKARTMFFMLIHLESCIDLNISLDIFDKLTI